MIANIHYAVELFLFVLLVISLLQCRKYKNLSEKDQFTNIFHKHWLNVNLVNLMRKAKLKNKTLGLAFLDLDNFKKINDTWGHAHGDYVILSVVTAICSVIGRNCKLVRYGGDEFILIADLNEEDFSRILLQVQQSIRNTGLITTSIGGTMYYPDEDLNFSKLIAKADKALYAAKEIPVKGFKLLKLQ